MPLYRINHIRGILIVESLSIWGAKNYAEDYGYTDAVTNPATAQEVRMYESMGGKILIIDFVEVCGSCKQEKYVHNDPCTNLSNPGFICDACDLTRQEAEKHYDSEDPNA